MLFRCAISARPLLSLAHSEVRAVRTFATAEDNHGLVQFQPFDEVHSHLQHTVSTIEGLVM